MKQMPISGVVMLGLFGIACAVEHWLRERNADRAAVKRKIPVQQWESEGGALAPVAGTTKTSQVPH
jgi:hypothetical protein